MRRAAAARWCLLICQNLGGGAAAHALPPCLQHACSYSAYKFILIWVIFFFYRYEKFKIFLNWEKKKPPLDQWGTTTCLLPLYKVGWLYLNDKIKVDVKGNRTGKSQLRQKRCESAFIKRSTQRPWSFFYL